MLAPAPNPLSFMVADFFISAHRRDMLGELYVRRDGHFTLCNIYIAVSYPPYFLSADFSGNAHINNYFRIRHRKFLLTCSVLQVI